MTFSRQQAFYIQADQVILPSGLASNTTLLIDNGKIAGVYPEKLSATESSYIQHLLFENAILLPGFIDLHVHGGGGWRIGLANRDVNAVEQVSRYLATTGTTSFLPTIATTTDDMLLKTVKQAASLVNKPLDGATVLGIHLEGPYLNPEKKGAMQQELFRDPSIEHFSQFWEVSQGSIRYVTLAPERNGSLALIRELCKLNVVVSAGHTNARADEINMAFASGITVVTHLFNAMRGVHHREPGVAGAALSHPDVWVELIGDGIHVHPAVMQIALRSKGIEKVAIITDGGSFMGQADGSYTEGHRTVTVKNKQVTLPDGTLAGSASPMNHNCMVLANELGLSWSDIAKLTSLNPARILGIDQRKGSLEVGKDADLVVMKPDGEVLLCMVEGRIAYQKEEQANLSQHT